MTDDIKPRIVDGEASPNAVCPYCGEAFFDDKCLMAALKEIREVRAALAASEAECGRWKHKIERLRALAGEVNDE